MLKCNFNRQIYFAILSLFPILVSGQYYNLGQDPGSLKWRQISTPHFRIVYPESFERKAIKLIPTLDYIYAQETGTLGYKPEKVPLIIHNYNIVPNAVTAWAPKRIELFTCPPQDIYSQDWLEQLMIHEYRHVIQIDRTNQGFTRILSWLTGEQAATMVNGLFVPSWFMEGDAVCAETALSNSGRGRLPDFEMLLRAQVREKGAYSYDKAALGSYKTFVPDHYVLGYTLVANVRRRYSYQAWIDALNRVACRPFLLTPFNQGLRKATGSGKEGLYRMTILDMDSMWKYQDKKTPKTQFSLLTSANKNKYENYKFPKYLNDSLVVSEYSCLDDITRFVLIGPQGFRKNLVTPGFLSSELFSAVGSVVGNNGKIQRRTENPNTSCVLAWTETINDLRWEQRSYSVIRTYTSADNKIKALTKRSRFFAPSFSPDCLTLAAVSVDPSNYCAIVLMDAQSGEVSDTIVASDSVFYMTPSFSEDGKELVFVTLDGNGKSIMMYNLENKSSVLLVQPTYTEISDPVFADGYVLFNGSYSGIENVYAVDLSDNNVYQVSSSGFGACNADRSPNGNKIVYSEYSSNGYHLAQADFNPSLWKKLDQIEDFSPSLYKYMVKEEAGAAMNVLPQSTLSHSVPYKKMSHIFNFHSWAPAYINYLIGDNGTGISFMSQNDLSTATTVLGYKYDMYENTGKVTADLSWKAWFPIVDLNTSFGGRAAYTPGDSSSRYNFTETVISGGITLPLLFTGGKYYKGIRLKVHSSWTDIRHNTSPREDRLSGTIHSIDYSVNAYRFIKKSGKDIFPRWGQVISGSFRHSPFGDNNLGGIASVGVRLYFPGMFIHQGLRTDFSWQKRNYTHYFYSDQITLPRGYFLLNENTISCFALNYKFPLAYPDLALGPLVYIKRVKANLFFDGGVGVTEGVSRKLQSAGVEISSDLHFFRFVFPMDIGFRMGYRPIEKHYFSDLLFSVNLSD